jgi:predicted nucleotidyltransferase component of viral defense system
MANNISSDGIGITEADAATANLGTMFKNNTTITSFNEFGLFNRANTSPANEMFRGCTNLENINLSNVTRFSNR